MARAIPEQSLRDIIVSRATAPGDGAIAIVRVSGPGTHELLARMFHPFHDTKVSQMTPGHMVLGRIVQPGATDVVIDTGFAVVWRPPHSYTGEEMVELQVHGSPVVVGQIVEACVAAGARLANPGEFTRRAYLNGKMDLAQAEAVCDLIHAQTEAARRAALAQLGGGLSRRLQEVREHLVPVIAELEAHIDFPEEGLEFSTRERLGGVVDMSIRGLQALHESAARGRYLREGARVVLAGPPNAGKSSLFNLLLRRERALVTPHPGTTRDTIEAQVDLAGVPLTLVDTAGLRQDAEEIEVLGIARTREELQAADLILFLVDVRHPEHATTEYETLRDLPHLLVTNKIDLKKGDGESPAGRLAGRGRRRSLAVSVMNRDGIAELEAALVEHFGGSGGREAAGLITNRRHAEALGRALVSLQTAAEGLASELSPEFIVVDLTAAVDQLDRITGRQGLDEDVLDAIFATFCLGK